MFSDSVSRFIGGSDQKPVKRLLHGNLFTRLDPHIGIGQPVNTVYRFIGIGDDIIQGTAFHGDQGCKNFGYAGRIKLVVDIFFIKDSPGIGFHQNSAPGADERACRPVFPCVGFHRHLLARLCFFLEAVSGSGCGSCR